MAVNDKHADASPPIGFDWSAWLLEVGEGMVGSSWSVMPSGLTLTNSTMDASTGQTRVTISGGTPGVVYRVKNLVHTPSHSDAAVRLIRVI